MSGVVSWAFQVLLDVFAAYGVLAWSRRGSERRSMPYHWRCPHPGCQFEIRGTGPAAVDAWITAHEATHPPLGGINS